MIYFGINQQFNKIQEVIIINSYDEDAFTKKDAMKTNDYEVLLRAKMSSVVNYLDNFKYDYDEDKFMYSDTHAIEFLFEHDIM